MEAYLIYSETYDSDSNRDIEYVLKVVYCSLDQVTCIVKQMNDELNKEKEFYKDMNSISNKIWAKYRDEEEILLSAITRKEIQKWTSGISEKDITKAMRDARNEAIEYNDAADEKAKEIRDRFRSQSMEDLIAEMTKKYSLTREEFIDKHKNYYKEKNQILDCTYHFREIEFEDFRI